MIATIKPIDREEYALTLESPPVFSSCAKGGYEQATVYCQLDD